MSFFSEKVLKRPPAEEIKGYSLREIEIARKNYNYGHNVCFYTVMVCFIIWAILCSVFRPSVAHASELLDKNEPIVTKFDTYLIYQSGSTYFCYVNLDYVGNYYGAPCVDGDAYVLGSSDNIDDLYSLLVNSDGSVSGLKNTSFKALSVDRILYANFDIHYEGKTVFQQTPLLMESTTIAGGLTPLEIARMTVIQILGLVPLVLGLVVSAIGLRKALAMVFQRLRRA